MYDWEMAGLIRKNKNNGKQLFLDNYNNFFFNFVYNITKADSCFIQKIIDDFFEQCYNEGMFYNIDTRSSCATKYIIGLRNFIIENKHIFFENNYKCSDSFCKYVEYQNNIQINKGKIRYNKLYDKTKTYVFVAKYFYFWDDEKIKRTLNIGNTKYEIFINEFKRNNTKYQDCCAYAKFIHPEVIEIFNTKFIPEYKKPKDILNAYPLEKLKDKRIYSGYNPYSFKINSTISKYIIIPLAIIVLIIKLIMEF